MLEDVAENLVGGDLTTRDVGKLFETDAEILTDKVTTELHVHAINDTKDGLIGTGEGFIMACRGDDHTVFVDLWDVSCLINSRLQSINVLLQFG